MTQARRGQEGGVPIEFAMGAALLLIPTALLVLTLPTWVERQTLARSAAAAVARAVAVAPSWSDGTLDAEAVLGELATGGGVGVSEIRWGVCGGGEGECRPSLERGGGVTATVTVRVPIVVLPMVGTVGGFDITATHVEPVDRYRSLR